jgi:hypothetical protein
VRLEGYPSELAQLNTSVFMQNTISSGAEKDTQRY